MKACTEFRYSRKSQRALKNAQLHFARAQTLRQAAKREQSIGRKLYLVARQMMETTEQELTRRANEKLERDAMQPRCPHCEQLARIDGSDFVCGMVQCTRYGEVIESR
jgi:hypothetical protein